MSGSLILLAASAGCFVIFKILLQLYRSLTSPLRSVPGPFLARFTDLWYFWKLWGGSFERVNKELHEKYGPVVRYGPNRYSFDDQTASKIIYGHGAQFAKSSWYNTWDNDNGQWNLFQERDIQKHAQARRYYQNTYSMSSLVEYEPYVDECADLYTQRLHELSNSGILANMGHWMQCYAFDVIGCITYSKRLGFLDRGEDIKGVISALEKALRYSTLVGVYPSLHPIFTKLSQLRKKLIPGSSPGGGVGYVMEFTRNRIAEHQSSPKAFDDDDNEKVTSGVARDFVSKFVGKHTQDPNNFTFYHIVQGCGNNMVAGSDTTAVSLSAILYYLLKNPGCFSKLRAEVEEFEAAGKITPPYIKFKQTQEMPYLQAVIKEALRLNPATGLPLERIVPPGGATICGRFFPEGSVVGVNTWIEHYNTNIFGQDAKEFRPERWLTDDPEKISFMNRHWMPFGAGSRTCIGRHISLLEISKLIPRLMRDFDFELSEELSKKDTKWSVSNFWFVKPKNFMVYVRSRGGL
ncbi:cytochrome P450 [Biscogniauxia marginata]|nr:cytochrome P450 [Biscogniauxia marginata]